MARAVELANGRRLRAVRFEDLDVAARTGNGTPLAEEEPELAGYLEGNLDADDPTLGGGKRERGAAGAGGHRPRATRSALAC